MGKYFLTAVPNGNIIYVTSIENGEIYNAPKSLLEGISAYTDTDENVLDLFTYLSTRLSSFLDTLELVNEATAYPVDVDKIIEIFTPSFISEIIKKLLVRVPYELIIDVLENVKDVDLFEGVTLLEDATGDDIVNYLLGVIEDIYDSSIMDDDDSYMEVFEKEMKDFEKEFNCGFHIVRG